MTAETTLTVTVNGTAHSLSVGMGATLLELLRDQLNLTGTKAGCHKGECGACTVLLDGEPVTACLVLAHAAEGCQVETVECAHSSRLRAIQKALVDTGAVQCGFCTPGIAMSALALLRECPRPTEDDVRRALAGNLCRCTGYARVVKAVLHAVQGDGP